MKELIQYQWRIKWCGRWTTSHYCAEEDIRTQHPEAVRVEGSRRVIMVPSTEEELRKRRGGPSRPHPVS